MVITCNNPRADINRDGVVDSKDLARLEAAFGSSPGDANWDPDADINQDGVINVFDLILLNQNQGCTFDAARRPPCGDYGDIDGDGYVTLKDAIYLGKYVAEIPGYTLTEDQKRRANVTGDGKIDVEDVATIHRYVAHVYDTFPVCKAAAPKVCTEGTKRGAHTCWNGSVIHAEVCRGNAWVPTGEVCPAMPAHGTKRNPTTCWDGSVIYAEKFDRTLKRWVPTGETCPTMPAHGTKRNPTTCWDGSVIYAEKFDRTLKRWVPTGEAPPPKPECSPGDKKPGYVCKEGKWVEYTPPEPVIEPTVSEIEEACYIKFDIPVLDRLPGIPCQWWGLPLLPGLKKTKKT